jgi:hypothetical protein
MHNTHISFGLLSIFSFELVAPYNTIVCDMIDLEMENCNIEQTPNHDVVSPLRILRDLVQFGNNLQRSCTDGVVLISLRK